MFVPTELKQQIVLAFSAL